MTDWGQAMCFYSETLGIATSFRDDAMGWAQFATGEAQLAIERLAPDDPEAAKLVGRFVGVSIEVPDIQVAYQTLFERGVKFVSPPEPQPWGGVLAHLEDPEQNVITLLRPSS